MQHIAKWGSGHLLESACIIRVSSYPSEGNIQQQQNKHKTLWRLKTETYIQKRKSFVFLLFEQEGHIFILYAAPQII